MEDDETGDGSGLEQWHFQGIRGVWERLVLTPPSLRRREGVVYEER